MKKTQKSVLALLALCSIALSLFGCSEIPVAVGTQAPAQGAVSPTAAGDPVFKVGEIVELSDVNVTLLSVKESKGAQFFEPAEGNIFLLCEFEIENKSTEELAVSSMLSFEAYCDDYTCSLSISALSASDQEQLDGTVAPGKKMKGVVGYEVPENWKELEVHYTLDLLNSKTIVFVATNE